MKLRHLSLALFLTVLVLLSAGCRAALPQALTQRFAAAMPTPVVNTAAPSSPNNRLLVHGADGNIYLASPDGAERFALTNDGSASRVYSQPTWSPDGSQIAWSRVDRRGSALVTSQFDGNGRSELRVPFAPFYFAWSPQGDQLAYLSNWLVAEEPSIALRLVDVTSEERSVQTLVDGQPLYFSWAPDGKQLLTHIGNERVELQAVDGEQTSLVISGGAFQSPQWAPDGEALVYALADAVRQYLVVADLTGNLVRPITDFDGRITFSMSQNGQQVAYVASERDAQVNTLGALYVVDLATQATRAITERPVVAFTWSPDGQKLAYLTLEPLRNRIGMRWNVWDGRERTAYSIFSPSSTFVNNYLPFFDQYAQSHRMWSPDSAAFVFVGQLADGRSGVWVQNVDATQAPLAAGQGVFASWSPQ